MTGTDDGGGNGLFLRDRESGTTTRAALGTAGQLPNASAEEPSLNRNARYVAFASYSTNLLGPGEDTNGATDVFVRYRGCEGLLPCDANCDGTVNNADLQAFLDALTGEWDPAEYPNCDLVCNNDANEDGSLNSADIPAFIDCLTD